MKHKLVTVFGMLLIGFNSSAQLNETTIRKKFEEYNSIWKKNKILLITNQDAFMASDTIYLACYLLNEDLTLEDDKQIVFVNFVDTDGNSRAQVKMEVVDGIGENQLILPNKLPPGNYLITAYTNWMRNFDSSYFYRKEIKIVGSNKLVSKGNTSFQVAIEGGHLISGQMNKVVFSTHIANSIIQVSDSSGSKIAIVTTDFNGIGAILFIPHDGMIYHVGLAGEQKQLILPKPQSKGLILAISPHVKQDSIQIGLTVSDSKLSNLNTFFLIISGKGKILVVKSINFKNQNLVEEIIPIYGLVGGIYQISIVDQLGQSIADRDFYVSPKEALVKEIMLSKNQFLTNDTVSMQFSLNDLKGNPLEANFSIKVINKRAFGSYNTTSLVSHLNLFYGKNDTISIDKSKSDWFESIDNYLLLNTEVVPWNEILKDQHLRPKYLQTNIIQRTGNAYFTDGKKMLDSVDVFFYGQKSKLKYQTKVIKGKVWIPLPKLYGQDELFYLAESFYYQNGVPHGLQLPNFRIAWDSDSLNLPRPVQSKESDELDSLTLYKLKVKAINNSYKANYLMDNFKINDVKEIWEADARVKADDYVVFPTMTEFIKEVVPALYQRTQNGKEIVRVVLPGKLTAESSGDPVYIIDGIATANTSYFLSIKPVDIIEMKIIYSEKKLRSFGLMGKNGIIIVETKEGNRREPIDQANLVEGIKKNFPFPKSSDIDSPKFRTTIFWQPSAKTDKSGNAFIHFKLSDDIGEMMIQIDGITINGTPFSFHRPIKVGLGRRTN